METIAVNAIQSVITEKKLKKLNLDIRRELYDIIDNIELVQNMIHPDRKYVHQMPKDSEGHVIVDLENPHILENMDYFRQPAINFEQNGKFTNAYPNPHPGSKYTKFWKQQAEYCRNGCFREDGEWITGYHYFYLNFGPILLSEDKKVTQVDSKNQTHIRAERVEGFPKIWDGDYLYFHYIEKGQNAGKYGTVLKTRGRGFSFKGGSMAARNQLYFKKSRTFMMAAEKEYLDKDGIWNKYVDTLDFNGEYTPLPSARLKNDQNKMHIVLGYEDPKLKVNVGLKSEVLGTSLKDNPNKARGKRGMLIQWEEAGKFPGLLQAWSIARMSLEDGRSVFGYMVAFGTGGTEGADFEALEKLFYYPEGYRVYSMRNVFDKVRGKGRCAFFFPEYLNRKHCYDKDGNSDVIKALLEILEDRDTVKKGTNDPHALTQEKADRPITPQEAVMRREGSLFPVEQLKDYLTDISPTLESFLAEHVVGHISLTKEGAEFKSDLFRYPIRDFPLKDNIDKGGAIEIFEHPILSKFGKALPNRYIAGIDTFDDDSSTTTSLGSIFIFDLWTDRIVAEYTGRPETANAFYEICAGLLMYYNAIGNYENNKKGLYAWFKNNQLDYLLCDTPEILKDMHLIKGEQFGNKAVGTNASEKINALGRRLQSDWMKEKAYTEASDMLLEEQKLLELEDKNIEIEENTRKIHIQNLRTIRSIGYIKEAIAWNPDGNFDRVSAMGMLMILRLDKIRFISGYKEEEYDEDALENDEFFGRIYNDKNNFDAFEAINKNKKNKDKIQIIEDYIKN